MEGEGIRWDDESIRRKVELEIFPNTSDKNKGDVVFNIDTGDRILTFETTYTLEDFNGTT